MNGDREFERLLAQRDLSWQQMVRAMGDALVVRGSGVVPTQEEPAASRFAFDAAGALSAPEFQTRRETLRDVREQDDLIGAARFYGIPGAEGMHLADLQEEIARRREMVREQNEIVSLPRALYEGFATAIGLGLTAPGKESLRILGNLSERFAFLGNSIARTQTVREADRWLAMVQEGLTADLPEERRKLARGVAGAVGMFAPAAFMWNVAGAAGTLPWLARIGKAVTPVGRVMIRGTATEVTLQDPTAPLNEQAINAGLGAVFGLGDLTGTVGRTMMGAGIGTMAGALADDGDPLTMLVSGAAGAAAFSLGGAALSKVQKSFPSRVIEEAEFAGFRRPEGPTLDAAFTTEGGPQALGPGPGTAVGPVEGPLANAYPRPGEPARLRGLLGLPPGPQEGVWTPAPQEIAPQLRLGPGDPNDFPWWQDYERVLDDTLPGIDIEDALPSSPVPLALPSGFPADVPPDYPPEVQRAVWGRLQKTYETFARNQPDNVFIERGPDGSVIGYLQIGEGRIQTVGVHPDFRRQGIGTALYQRAAAAGHPIEQMSDFSAQYGNLSPMGQAFQKGRRLKAQEAAQEAAQLTKQEAILESPALAELSSHAILDDASVARAVVESYPGQVGVVQNVQDVAGTLRKILMEQMPSGVGPQDFRVVKRPTHVKLFHGTLTAFDRIDPEFTEGSHTFFATDPSFASDFAVNSYRTAGVPPEARPRNVYMASIPVADLPRNIVGGSTQDFFNPHTGVLGLTPESTRKLGPPIFGPVPEQTDILVSSGRPISNQMVKDYETFGMFSGQRARLTSGQEVVIESLSGNEAVVRSGSQTIGVPLREVLPYKSSQIVDDIPGLYEDFSLFAQVRLDEQSRQAGIVPFDLLSNEGATQTPLLMEEYIKGMGVDPRSYYGASLRWLMEQKHIEALRDLTPPDERAFAKDLQAEYRQVVEERGLPEPTLDDMAQARGFAVDTSERIVEAAARYQGQIYRAPIHALAYEQVPGYEGSLYGPVGGQIEDGFITSTGRFVDRNEAAQIAFRAGQRPTANSEPPSSPLLMEEVDTESVVLNDAYSKEQVRATFENEDAAREFLAGIQREPIDDSPVGHVPLEVMETPLGYSMTGGMTPGVYRDAEHWLDHTTEFLEDLEPPPSPPGGDGPGGLPPVGDFPRLPEGDDPWGSAFESARKDHPAAYRKALGKLDSLLTRAYLPTRNYAIRLDNLLRPLGIPSFERLITNMQNAHNIMVSKAFPWEQRAIAELEKIPRKLRRDGTLWNIMNSEVGNWHLMMDEVGMSAEERQAVRNLHDIFIQFDIDEVIHAFPKIAERESFVNHFKRFEEALPGEGARHPRKATFGPAEVESEGVDWVAEKNIDAIVARYFRSFYKTQYMNAPYELLRNAVKDRRVPQVIKDGVGGWAKARMWGLDPTKDILIKGVHSIVNRLAGVAGQRVSIGEISSLLHAEMSLGYHSALGGRPDVIIRDMPQALIGIMHVGMEKGAPILVKILRDKEYRKAAFDLAFDAGWAVPGHGMAVDPDIFGGSAFTALEPGRELTISQLPVVERTVDWLSDHVVKRMGLGRGLQGSWADLLKTYGTLSDIWRVWNGMTGYDTAWKALAKYDAGKLYRTGSVEELERQLLDDARVARFQGPIQDGFLEFARKGDFEGAARYFGRHVADSQIRYGMAEHPQVWRNLGPQTGRRAMKYLSYNSQMMANFGQIISDPRITAKNKVAYLGQVGGMQFLFGLGMAYTGWNLAKMGMTGLMSGIAGTGLFDLVNDTQRALAFVGLIDPSSGPTPDEAALMSAGRRGYGTALLTTDLSNASWNPWAGAIRTAANLTESAQWGGEAVLRTLVTGQVGDPSVERRQLGLEPYNAVGVLPEDLPYYNPQPGGSQ